MTFGIIYVAENTVNGKKYVGQTIRPMKVRWQQHCRKVGNGCAALSAAIAKYGAEAFTVSVVAQASSKEELNHLEAALVVALDTLTPSGYNLRSGGGSKGRHSVASREKMVASHRTAATREKHVAHTKARWSDEEYRLKMTGAMKAFWANPETKEAQCEKLREAAANPDTQRKKSEALKRYYANPESIEKLRRIKSQPEAKAKTGAFAKKQWADPAYRANQHAKRRAHWTPEKWENHLNLRVKFVSQHGLAARSDNRTGYKGVKALPSGKFAARATINKKLTHIGVYDTAEQAHTAYVEFVGRLTL